MDDEELISDLLKIIEELMTELKEIKSNEET